MDFQNTKTTQKIQVHILTWTWQRDQENVPTYEGYKNSTILRNEINIGGRKAMH